MKKSIVLLLAVAGLGLTACTTDDSVSGADASNNDTDPVILSDAGAVTRSNMSVDLANSWADGDALGVFESWDETSSGSFADYGKQNAKLGFRASFTYGGISYTNRFIQDGVLEKTIASSDMVGFDKTSDVTHFKSYYTYYTYFPYVSTATKTSVPFTLSSTQTQTTPNVWSNQSAGSNFTWYAAEKIMRPADRIVPIGPNRLLPVAEFNIIRDDATLDGYYLTSVIMTPTSGTMATGAITGGIDLTAVSGYSTLTFGSTAEQYTLDTKGTGSGIQVADANVTKDHSFSVYMSVPPAADNAYRVSAIFTNGTDIRAITVTRSDAFTITSGKGNLIRYYFKSSAAVNPAEKVNKLFDCKYYVWDEVLKTTDGGVIGTGHNGYLEFLQDYNSKDATDRTYNGKDLKTSYNTITDGVATNVCKDCPTYDQIQMYLAAGVYWGDGPDGYVYVAPNGATVTKGLWMMKKEYITGFDDGTAAKITQTTSSTKHPSAQISCCQYFT
jgi:hypothetical protein